MGAVMADDYLHSKVFEALKATDGHRHDAQKLIITWAVRDVKLLLALAKPHLKAIVTGVIDHVLRMDGHKNDEGSAHDEHIARGTIDSILAKGAVKHATDKRRRSNLPPPQSTERQANAMRRLAEAYKKKDSE